MSVLVLSPSEYGSIRSTLKIARTKSGGYIFPLSLEEHYEFKLLFEPAFHKSEDDFRLDRLTGFIDRLYLANAMAEQYTYAKPEQEEITIRLIDFPSAAPLPVRELLEDLESVSYNVITNGGNSFLGPKDGEKLEQVIDTIKDELIGRI